MPTTRRKVTVAALAGVVVAAAGFGAYRAVIGPTGEKEGTTEGFIATEPAPNRAPGAWPEYGFDAQRRRANETLDLEPPFRETWRFDAASLIEFPPVIAEGRAIVGLNDGRVVALDVTSGQKQWEVKLAGQIASSPAITGTSALITTTRGVLVSLDTATGTRRWRTRIGSKSETSPLVVGGSTFVATLDGEVLRVAVANGRVEWRQKTPGPIKASLAASGPNVVVGDYAGRVSAFAQTDGKLVWRVASAGPRFRGSGRFYAGPAVAYGRVYIGNINGYAMALDAATGEQRWVQAYDGFIYSSAAVAKRTVFFGSYDANLYAVDAVTGRERWRYDTGERISGSPSVIGRLVYVSTLAPGGRKGVTTALDVTSGKVVWTHPDGRYSPAVAIDGMLLICGREILYGFVPA